MAGPTAFQPGAFQSDAFQMDSLFDGGVPTYQADRRGSILQTRAIRDGKVSGARKVRDGWSGARPWRPGR